MYPPENEHVDPARIVALGTAPPPVTGMTLVTAEVIKALQSRTTVDFFDWSTGLSRRGIKFRLARFLRIISSLIWLTKRGRVSDAPLYLVANSKSGLRLTAVVVWVARRLGYRIYLHHHTYYYIDERDRRMAWIDHAMGSHSVHVVHTPQMAEDFRARYATQCRFAFVYPSIIPISIGESRSAIATPIRLGYLSNLQFGKGLDLAIECFRELRKRGRDVTLTLAGAVLKHDARQYVQQAVAEFPGLVEYVGPVYGDQKKQFFGSVDVFVFPTRSESWGLVLHEAMAAGVPVITFDRGCTKTVVGNDAGLVIKPENDFVTIAADAIEQWSGDAKTYVEASRAAIRRAIDLNVESRRSLDDFIATIVGEQPHPRESRRNSQAAENVH